MMDKDDNSFYLGMVIGAILSLKDDKSFYLGMIVGAIVSLMGVVCAIIYNGI